MGVTNQQYVNLLRSLLPPGIAWGSRRNSSINSLLQAVADEFLRVHKRVGEDLLREVFPDTSSELLDDWERVLGLPDPCIGEAQSTQERRDQILYRLTNRGGQSRQYFIDIAAALGFTITITEFDSFRVGISTVGDALTNGPWEFAWQVNAPSNTIKYFRTGLSVVGDPLASWSNVPLECIINRNKPAHTIVLFAYAS